MNRILLLLFIVLLLMSSCASSKNISNTKADSIITNAEKYIGTSYKYGGTSRAGMDCSGLVYTAFAEENIQLPRVSRYMAKEGTKIPLKKVKKGDLLFFKTLSSRRINHVGVVSFVENKNIKFIHSTNSRGVIESSLLEKYWKKAFVKAIKIVN